MEPTTVPDFFQSDDEESLRSRAKWLDTELGLDTLFLSKVINMDLSELKEWRNKATHMTPTSQKNLSALWHVVLHLLSHFNNEPDRLRRLFEEQVSADAAKFPRHPLSPPWIHSPSLKDYMKSHGVKTIDHVNRWIMSLRFGDPYSSAV